MKKFNFLALAAAGMLLGACSTSDDAQKAVATEEIGEGYIALSVNLPTTPVSFTRATDDNGYESTGTFDLADGLDNEYAVSDVHLLIFTPGTKEDDATFKTAFTLTTTWPVNSDPHVTVNSAKLIQKVGSTVAVNDLALVVLNANDIYTFTPKASSDYDEQDVKVKNGATDVDLTGKTFGDLRKYIVNDAAIDNALPMKKTSTSFYMTNSPLFKKKGSTKTDDPTGTEYRTLVPITNVYPTEAEASLGTPDEIFVERGMVKVTLKQLASGKTLGATLSDGTTHPAISIIGWSLDQTNTKSYFIRSTDNIDKFDFIKNGASQIYRFTGNTAIQDANHPGEYKYRGYFAEDPNFTGGAGELSHAASLTYSEEFGDDNPQYCFENTFDVENQLRKNTTLAQLKVKVGDGTVDYYMVNSSTSTVYVKAEVDQIVKNAVFTFLESKSLVKTGASSTNVGTVTYENGTPASVQVIKTVDVSDATYFESTAATQVATDLAASDSKIKAAVGSIVKYTDGVSYYAIRIKHFGDQLTPWHVGSKSSPIGGITWLWDDTGTEATTPTPGNIYPSYSYNDYLGRYGVLRNNWYDLQVNSIKALGSADPIDYTSDDTPDDELDGYISVKINVLSWAKRTQGWDL